LILHTNAGIGIIQRNAQTIESRLLHLEPCNLPVVGRIATKRSQRVRIGIFR
jgi:hypothetical protein